MPVNTVRLLALGFALTGSLCSPICSANEAFVSQDVRRALAHGTAHVLVTLHTPPPQEGDRDAGRYAAAMHQVLRSLPNGEYSTRAQYSHFPIVALAISPHALPALARHPLVSTVTLDRERFPMAANAADWTQASALEAEGATGEGVRVAVIDSGISSQHRWLADDLVAQACPRVENDCPGGASSAEDQTGHGTTIASTITGEAGVAPDAEIIALKVFTDGATSDASVLAALDLILAHQSDWSVDILSLSLAGLYGYSSQEQCNSESAAYAVAFEELNARQIAIFAAAGSAGSANEISAPACVSGALAVGSADSPPEEHDCLGTVKTGDQVSCYANSIVTQGADGLLDLLAPGCIARSEWVGEKTAMGSTCGTSIATAVAAGVAATLRSADPSLLPQDLEKLLKATAVPVIDTHTAVAYPRIDALAALAELAPALSDAPALTAAVVSSMEVTLEWTNVAGEDGYELQRSAEGVTWGTLALLAADVTAYADAAPLCGSNFYRIRARVNDGGSAFSDAAEATPRGCPAAPTDLTASVLSQGTVRLDWADNAEDEAGYVVQRQEGAGEWTELARLSTDTTTYVASASRCAAWAFRTAAYVGNDVSQWSNVASATPCAPVNDLIENATLVRRDPENPSPDTRSESDIRYATVSLDDPWPSCRFNGAHPGTNNVWFKLSPLVDERVTIDTSGSLVGQNDDTVLAIYTGSPEALTERACHEDIDDEFVLASRIENLPIVAGTSYYVLVTRWDTAPMTTDGLLKTTFEFTTIVSPGGFDLLIPAHGSELAGSPDEFQWSASSGAQDYQLTVSTAVGPLFVVDDITGTRYEPTAEERSAMNVPGPYTWAVVARDLDGAARPASAELEFQVQVDPVFKDGFESDVTHF